MLVVLCIYSYIWFGIFLVFNCKVFINKLNIIVFSSGFWYVIDEMMNCRLVFFLLSIF